MSDQTPVRNQILEILQQLAAYTAAEIPAIIMLQAAGVRVPAGIPGPLRLRRKLAKWIAEAQDRGELGDIPPRTAANILIGTLEAQTLHSVVLGRRMSRNSAVAVARDLARAILDIA